jgi:hypothetical protein
MTVSGVDGMMTRVAYSDSKLTDWIIGIGIDEASMSVSLNRSLISLVVGGAVLLSLGLALAFWYGRRIAAQATILSAHAAALGDGVVPPQHSFDILELGRVAGALDIARRLLPRPGASNDARHARESCQGANRRTQRERKPIPDACREQHRRHRSERF